jgi:antitoxin (DNA-binding transcriptional repressor) of toxin-antitoxin stability system
MILEQRGESMSFRPSVTEVARHFADYVNRVAYSGERFVLMRGGKAVAELGPVPAGRSLRELPDLLASLPRLSDAEAADFEHDLEAARAELVQSPLRDPWES